MRGEVLLRSGLAVYDTEEPNLWGDYSSTVVDPANDTSFWTIQEYARPLAPDGSSRWGTWWGRVDPPAVEVFRRGDANSDGRVDISNAIAVLFGVFGGGPPLPCPDASEADDNASLTLTEPSSPCVTCSSPREPLRLPALMVAAPTRRPICCLLALMTARRAVGD